MKKTIYSICMVIFEITLPLFLIMGAVLVYTQLFGAIIGDGKLVKTINSSLKTYSTYSVWVSCVCAFSGFIMSYTKEKKKGEKKAEEE